MPSMGEYKHISSLESAPLWNPVNIIGKVLRVTEPQQSPHSTWTDIYVADLSRCMIKVRLWGNSGNIEKETEGQVYSIHHGKLSRHKGMLCVHDQEGTVISQAVENELPTAIAERVKKDMTRYTDITLKNIESVDIADVFNDRDVDSVVTIKDCQVNDVIDEPYLGCTFCRTAVSPYSGSCQKQTCMYAGQKVSTEMIIRVKLILSDESTTRPLYVSAFGDVVTNELEISSEEYLALPEPVRCYKLRQRLTGEDLAVTVDVIWKGQRAYPLGTVIDIRKL